MAGFNYSSTSQVPGSMLGGIGGLQGVFGSILGDVNSGRPGSLDHLYRTLDALGSAEGMSQQRWGFEQNAPYATDQAQQGRFQFQQLSPYMADPYQRQRQQWDVQYPYMQNLYNQGNQDLMSRYRNVMGPLPFGGY